MTYRELHRRSDAVASILRASGLGSGSFVALSIERSLDMMVALWGIVKSGAAYIPVDPAYPDARIAHMAESARWDAWLMQDSFEPRARSIPHAGALIRLAPSHSSSTFNMDSNPDCEPDRHAILKSPHAPFYAIFTSGSTGAPKAAVVHRAGIENLLTWYSEAMGLDASTRALVFSSLSFDLTQKNLFAPLFAGGTVILQPPGPYDIRAILSEIERRGVTLLNTTPSAFYPLVDAAAAQDFAPLAPLRAVVLGGEPISIPRLRVWLEHPHTRAFIANTYGPTECTDICAWYKLDRANLDAYPYVPVGHAIPGATIVLLDEKLKPVPTGEIGELCIAGIGVGGGYLRDPARTRERFIANPVPEVAPGDVLYRTGDLARMHVGGVIEFRGRLDHQVKVRGFRLELGEIEHTLAAHPAVREAVVTASNTGTEDARLTAWLTPRTARAETSEIRAYLAARVPAHMVPDAIEWLDQFPLTPNAKVDRLALQRRAQPVSIAAPPPTVGDAERAVLALWGEALGHPVDNPSVNFFDMGGNSIQLATLHAKLCAHAGREFPITELFEHTTARAQARHLAGAASDSRRQAILDRAQRQRALYSRPTHER